jgi:hypothetical protein
VGERKLNDAVVLISSPYVCDIRPMPASDLTRNESSFQGNVLFVLDIPQQNKELFNYYPERNFYRYEWQGGKGKGSLVKLDARSANELLP